MTGDLNRTPHPGYPLHQRNIGQLAKSVPVRADWF